MTVYPFRMPVGFGRGIKNKDRPLSVMAHFKIFVVGMKNSENCLTIAILIAIEEAENNPDYKAYGQSRKISPVVQKLLARTCIDLFVVGGIRN